MRNAVKRSVAKRLNVRAVMTPTPGRPIRPMKPIALVPPTSRRLVTVRVWRLMIQRQAARCKPMPVTIMMSRQLRSNRQVSAFAVSIWVVVASRRMLRMDVTIRRVRRLPRLRSVPGIHTGRMGVRFHEPRNRRNSRSNRSPLPHVRRCVRPMPHHLRRIAPPPRIPPRRMMPRMGRRISKRKSE